MTRADSLRSSLGRPISVDIFGPFLHRPSPSANLRSQFDAHCPVSHLFLSLFASDVHLFLALYSLESPSRLFVITYTNLFPAVLD